MELTLVHVATVRSCDAWIMQWEWEGQPVLSIARLDARYLVRCHDRADFLVEADGQRVAAELLPATSESEAQTLFSLQVLPAIHQLGGTVALHASAVLTPFGAIAFVGPSGAGKSTLASLLSDSGWPLISDDALPFRLEGERVLVVPSAKHTRLRSPSAAHLGAREVDLFGKFIAPQPSTDAAHPLLCVYFLEQGPEVGSSPRSKRDALASLAQNLLRMDPNDPTLLKREFETLGRIAEAVDCRTLRYPHRFDISSELRGHLEGRLRELRL